MRHVSKFGNDKDEDDCVRYVIKNMIGISIKQNIKRNCRHGFALIGVLLIIALLAAFIIEFNYESRIKLHLADNYNRSNQALNNADAGIAIAIAALKQNDTLLTNDNTRSIFTGSLEIPIEDGTCTISIAEESGKININALCTPDGKIIQSRVEQLLRLIDNMNKQSGRDTPISYSIVPAIIDWVDSDDDVTMLPFIRGQNSGAETNYYQKLNEPYHCKNATFDVLSELLLVKGMTKELFYGRSENVNTSVKSLPGIGQYLTIYGDGKININEASSMVIQSLSENMSQPLAQNIVEQRQFRRYLNIEQLKQVQGMTSEVYDEISPAITVKTKDIYYIVTAKGVVEDFEQVVKVVLRKNPSTSNVDVLMRFES